MTSSQDWRECPHCGQICLLPKRTPGMVADCPRCGAVLWRMRAHKISYPLACAIAASLFYLYALAAPFLEIFAYGRFSLARLATGPVQLIAQGWPVTAAFVFAFTLVLPGVKLGILLTTLTGLELRLPRAPLRVIFRWYHPVSPWAMMDVYLLGFLVAYTRLTGMAFVQLDTALYALVGHVVAMAAADGSLDHEQIWRKLDARDSTPRNLNAPLIACRVCGFVDYAEPGETCRRCHSVLTRRKAHGISRAWALLIAAAFLYVPANLYPFMDITKLANTQSYTIMDGIAELMGNGLWPLALLVLFASICIPLFKLLSLSYMLIATQRGSAAHLTGRTIIYRVLDFVGRWSMIDVFMVSILVALVRFGQFADVRAGLGAACFALVVVLTIFAVNVFDPREMWDRGAAS